VGSEPTGFRARQNGGWCRAFTHRAIIFSSASRAGATGGRPGEARFAMNGLGLRHGHGYRLDKDIVQRVPEETDDKRNIERHNRGAARYDRIRW